MISPQFTLALVYTSQVLLTLCSEFGVIEACVSPLVELKIFQGEQTRQSEISILLT